MNALDLELTKSETVNKRLLNPLVRFCLTLLFSAALGVGFAQQESFPPPSRTLDFLDKTSGKASSLLAKLDARVQKTVKKFKRQEQRMAKKLARRDSLATKRIFATIGNNYSSLQLPNERGYAHYIPRLDTLKTSLKFLESRYLF